jgi:hypothetical protein
MASFQPIDDWNDLKCKYCNTIYATKGNLKRHETDKHSEELRLLKCVTGRNNSQHSLCSICNIFVHVAQYEHHVTYNEFHLYKHALNTSNKRVCFCFVFYLL